MLIILSSSIDLLNVNTGLAVWTFVTFLLVFLLLWKFAWKPIADMLDKRNQKIIDDLDKSRELREKAERLSKEYEKQLQVSKKEAEKIIERAHYLADEHKKEALKKTQQEIVIIKEHAASELENEKRKGKEEFESKVLDVTILALSALMRHKITTNEHKGFIVEEIRKLSNLS